jgi:hypothetical protein
VLQLRAPVRAVLFTIAAETLQEFAQKRWDGKLGMIMVLHTWGQTLNDPPHVHCIVTGGAFKNDGSAFVRAPKHFLFHVKALSKVFRGKYIAALQGLRDPGKLSLSGQPELATEEGWEGLRQALRAHDWVVYAKPPFDDPSPLIRSLGRYINRIAIGNHRILSIDAGVIRFKYLDNREQEPVEKLMPLSAEEFIRRFLSHIPPPQFRRICYYGFLANGQRQDKLTLCRTRLGLEDPPLPSIPDMDAYLEKQGIDHSLCPCCSQGKTHTIYEILSFHDPPACYLEAA